MRLEGKVAIITGAAGGMGAEEARLFAREGAKVVIADVLDDEGKQVEAEIAEAGGEATYVRANVTSENSWERLIAETISLYGKLDILVNNAGVSSGSEQDKLDFGGWQRIMDVNATGVFLGTKYAVAADAGDRRRLHREYLIYYGLRRRRRRTSSLPRVQGRCADIHEGDGGAIRSGGHSRELCASGVYAADADGKPGSGRSRRTDTPDAPAKDGRDHRSCQWRAVPRIRRCVLHHRHGTCDRRRLHSALDN